MKKRFIFDDAVVKYVELTDEKNYETLKRINEICECDIEKMMHNIIVGIDNQAIQNNFNLHCIGNGSTCIHSPLMQANYNSCAIYLKDIMTDEEMADIAQRAERKLEDIKKFAVKQFENLILQY
jgi:hypothetical protein